MGSNNMKLNDSENAILNALRQSPSATNTDIAHTTGLPIDDVNKIIQSLKDQKKIVQYTSILEQNKDNIHAVIEVKIQPSDSAGYDDLARKISQFTQIINHYLISGSYDYLIMAEDTSIHKISELVSQLACLDQVQSTTTHFILKKYKECKTLLTDSSSENRLAISP